MKYIHYVQTETENKLLKSIYKCLTTEQKLKGNCKLLNMEKQMSNFIRTRPRASQNATFATFKNRIVYEIYLNLKDIEKRKQIA